MKNVLMIAMALVLFGASASYGTGNPVKKEVDDALGTFAVGCQIELTTFCKEVLPGEGRLLACLYAFGDKVSPKCEYALYDSMGQLNRTLANFSYAVNECIEDMETLCGDTEVGQGRVLDCLKQNKEKVSKRCSGALQDVGWVE